MPTLPPLSSRVSLHLQSCPHPLDPAPNTMCTQQTPMPQPLVVACLPHHKSLGTVRGPAVGPEPVLLFGFLSMRGQNLHFVMGKSRMEAGKSLNSIYFGNLL